MINISISWSLKDNAVDSDIKI